MDAQATGEILRFFRDVPDPRGRNAWHRLWDVLTIAILAVFCGSRGWADVEFWAHHHKDWLATFLKLPHGIPAHVGRLSVKLPARKPVPRQGHIFISTD